MILPMKVMALSGGIATGKSTFLAMMAKELSDLAIYDCDEGVQRYLSDRGTLDEIEQVLEVSILSKGGSLDRVKLRTLVFENPDLRQKLEGVIHPKLRKECLEKVAECRRNR
ncbi:MAG: dephospho-CoA kinase, partial [Akkermansiaceae bacterium]|nr:dephospho-CoA kinase [Akkermansiaceae bacterium]